MMKSDPNAHRMSCVSAPPNDYRSTGVVWIAADAASCMIDDVAARAFGDPSLAGVAGGKPWQILTHTTALEFSLEVREKGVQRELHCQRVDLPAPLAQCGYAHALLVSEMMGGGNQTEPPAGPDEDGSLTLAIRDITNHETSEKRLRESEARWKFALEGNGDAVWDWNITNGSILFGANFKRMLGYADDELVDSYEAWESCVHPDDLPRVLMHLDACLNGETDRYACEIRMRRASGDYLWIQDRGMVVERDETGQPRRMVGTQRDISETVRATESMQRQLIETLELNRKLEEAQLQLVQSEKLSVIGQLAAGVAHEMNTPLGFVKSNLNTLERYALQLLEALRLYHSASTADAEPGTVEAIEQAKAHCAAMELDYVSEDLPALLSETRDGLNRVLSIVRDLRDFSRTGEQRWEIIDLHRGIDSTLNILHNELKHNVEVVRDYAELPPVRCIPSQINQVILNLLNNARQAIKGHGRITIRTQALPDAAVIEVEDTGCGIDEENLHRIFEPFFTTKPAGAGTGLGLSLSLDIVRRHGGKLRARSVVGEGSVFSLWLPAATLDVDGYPDPSSGGQAESGR